MASTKVAFRRTHTGTIAGEGVQRVAQETAKRLGALPFSDGVWVRRVPIGTSATTVDHGLGRLPRGWLVTRVTGAAASLAEDATQPPNRKVQLNFVASDPGATFDMWIF